jgi:hypothetical protein
MHYWFLCKIVFLRVCVGVKERVYSHRAIKIGPHNNGVSEVTIAAFLVVILVQTIHCYTSSSSLERETISSYT